MWCNSYIRPGLIDRYLLALIIIKNINFEAYEYFLIFVIFIKI